MSFKIYLWDSLSPIEWSQAAWRVEGKTVSAVQGSYNEGIIRKLAPEAKILVFQEYPQAFLALKQGLADAFTTTATILEGVSKKQIEQAVAPVVQ